jgi:hypothetical protein
MTSDVELCLEANTDALAEIAAETEFEGQLVHLVAVLVLAGLDDATIHAQLHGLMQSLNGRRSPLAGASDALERIRRLAPGP